MSSCFTDLPSDDFAGVKAQRCESVWDIYSETCKALPKAVRLVASCSMTHGHDIFNMGYIQSPSASVSILSGTKWALMCSMFHISFQ